MIKQFIFDKDRYWILDSDRKGKLEKGLYLTVSEGSDIEFFDNKDDWEENLKKKNIK